MAILCYQGTLHLCFMYVFKLLSYLISQSRLDIGSKKTGGSYMAMTLMLILQLKVFIVSICPFWFVILNILLYYMGII